MSLRCTLTRFGYVHDIGGITNGKYRGAKMLMAHGVQNYQKYTRVLKTGLHLYLFKLNHFQPSTS